MTTTPDKDPPLVSIVISTYNRAATLVRTLDALFYLRYPRFEVLVVNGPSTDDTLTVLQAYAGSVRVLQCSERNLSMSRNVGIVHAMGEVVAFIDDDAIPEPDWLDQLVPLFDDERIAAAGGFIRDHTGVRFQAKYVVADLFGSGEGFDTYDQADCEESPAGERYFSLTGTNSAFRRAALVGIGGFDETFEYFLDETDVNLRLVQAGFASAVNPEAEVHHKYAASHLRTERNVPKNMFPTCRSVAYFAVIHALERYGWKTVKDRLIRYETSELMWKASNLAGGDITAAEFRKLIHQIRMGIREGVVRGVHYRKPALQAPPAPEAPDREQTPFRAIRPAGDRLRLCLLSQDEGGQTQGGIGRWTRAVAAGLARRGHEVSVIGRAAIGHDTVDFTDDGYWRHLVTDKHEHDVRENVALGLPDSVARYSRSTLKEYLRVDRRRRFDVVSGPIWDVEPAAFLSAGIAPVCLSLHTTAAIALESKPEWRANQDFYKNHVRKVIAAEKSALKAATLVLANSHAIVRDIEGLYGIEADRRFQVVPHGIEDVPVALRTRGLTHERPQVRILFVGRLEHRKGVDNLVAALDRLLDQNRNVVVDFVGQGVDTKCISDVQGLQDKYRSRVRHHGFVTLAALEDFYADADIFVAPSRYESFGLILIEAMRYSIPCVSTRVGGIPEVVSDEVNGLLAEPEDVASLHDNLARLCDDRDLRRTLGSAGRKRYEDLFTLDAMVDGLERFYRRAGALKS